MCSLKTDLEHEEYKFLTEESLDRRQKMEAWITKGLFRDGGTIQDKNR